MSAISNQEHEIIPLATGGLASQDSAERYTYALRRTQILLENPELAYYLSSEMGYTTPEATAIIKRLGIINASPHQNTVKTESGLAYYSSDDGGAEPVKPAVLVQPNLAMKPTAQINSPFKDAAIITINPPANKNLLQFRFVNQGIFTSEESAAAAALSQQTGHLARWVVLGQAFPEGDSHGNGNLEAFLKTAHYDQKPGIKLNRGINGLLSGWGIGEVTDASKHGDEVHVFGSKKGVTISTDTWGIYYPPGLGHPLLRQKS